MGEVIWFPYDTQLRQWVIDLHFSRDGGFKSANEIAKILGMRLSVVKAILKRGY